MNANTDLDFIGKALDSTGKLPRRFVLCGESMSDEGQFLDTKISEVMDLYGNRRLPHIGFANIFSTDKYENLFIYRFETPRLSDFRGGFISSDGKTLPVRFIPKDSYALEYTFTLPWAQRRGFYSEKIIVQQREEQLGKLEYFSKEALASLPEVYTIIPPFNKKRYPNELFLWAQMYLSAAFDVYHRWLVGIKRKDIEICFPFLRHDIKEVYKLRDIPDGKKRRDALKTIVSRHKRGVADSGSITEVREHFRNTDSFTMDGEKYTIYPSHDDAARIGNLEGGQL